jgi:transposase
MFDYTKTVVGLDVHKESIVAAVLPPDSDRPALTTKIENTSAALKTFVERLRSRGALTFVYEAGPCGYQVHRDLTAQGQECVVIAPGLIPIRPGDKVKTDRDLVRAREDVLSERLRSRHRLGKFLLRHGLVWRTTKAWSVRHREWLKALRFELASETRTFEAYLRGLDEAEARLNGLDREVLALGENETWKKLVANLRCLKGVDTLSAVTLGVEVRDFWRFASAREFMGYTGLVSREYSSGESVKRTRITKVGNAHVRRVLVEAAWSYRRSDRTGKTLLERREGGSSEAVATARRAQERLCRKFQKMVGRGKPAQKAVIAVARELAGFVWHIGRLSKEVRG